MLDLLNTYNISEIIVFIVILGLAIKGVIDFYDWAKERLRKTFNKEISAQENHKQVQDQIQDVYKELQEIKNLQKKNEDALHKLTETTNLLVASDKDDIKAFITREHHYFCYQKGWIDDYSLDCIKRRHSHYKEEGGNSFIQSLMDEIDKLPKQPPEL